MMATVLTLVSVLDDPMVPLVDRFLDNLVEVAPPVEWELVLVPRDVGEDGIACLSSTASSLATVRMVEPQSGIGFGAAANRGVEVSAGEHLLFIDLDLLPGKGSIEKMLGTLQAHREVGAVQGLVVDASRGTVLDAGYTFSEDGAYPLFRGRRPGENVVQRCESRQALDISFCMMSREMFDRLGRFDPGLDRTRAGMRLTFAIQQAGFECRYLCEPVAYRTRGGSGEDAGCVLADALAGTAGGGRRVSLDDLGIEAVLDLDRFLVRQLRKIGLAAGYIAVPTVDRACSERLLERLALPVCGWKQVAVEDGHIGPGWAAVSGLLHEATPLLFVLESVGELACDADWLGERSGSGDIVIDLQGNAGRVVELLA